jgi:hypothetical protein
VHGVRDPVLRIAAATGLEAAMLLGSTYLPFGNTWLHEEYHRAVLSSEGISSYDGIYDFNLDIDNISVYNIVDEALINLKAQHPEDLVRLEAAGYEGQVDIANTFLSDQLHHGTPLVEFPAFYALFANTVYLYLCTTKQADEETNEFNEKENTIDVRDFDGWDYSSWSYDLHRPDEPYIVRGIHPSGVGINRYLLWTDLTADEQEYVRLQIKLSLLNFVRPQLFGVRPLNVELFGTRVVMTGGMQHYLTPFGYEIGLCFDAAGRTSGLTAALNFFHNDRLVLPEIDVKLLDVPFSISQAAMIWSPRLVLWLQPQGQRFESTGVSAGMLTSQRLGIALNRFFGSYAELELKTTGWVSGVESIEPAIDFRLGGILKF